VGPEYPPACGIGVTALMTVIAAPLGVSLLPVMQTIKSWAETHIEEVHTARDTYDAHTSRVC
jgi:hypothetical protein